MSWIDTFSPATSTGTVNIALSTASQAVALTNVVSQTIRVFNDASVTTFVAFGSSTVTASTASALPVAAGVTEVFRPNGNATYVSAMVSSGAGVIYFTPGAGN